MMKRSRRKGKEGEEAEGGRGGLTTIVAVSGGDVEMEDWKRKVFDYRDRWIGSDEALVIGSSSDEDCIVESDEVWMALYAREAVGVRSWFNVVAARAVRI
jgi:hypothetical protein